MKLVTERLIIQSYPELYYTYDKLKYGHLKGGRRLVFTPSINSIMIHSVRDNHAQLGWSTSTRYRNKGFLKEALTAIIPDIFQVHGFDYLEVWVSKLNPYAEYSKKAALGAGFTYTHDDDYYCQWFKLERTNG